MGLAGLLLGGLFTDWCRRKVGVRLGRLIPWAGTRLLAASGFVLAIYADDKWALIAAFGMVAFFSDAGLPATWAWATDVGGRNVAPIFGWANMWGNFGAALQPLMHGAILLHLDHNKDWHETLMASATAFVLAGVCSLGINSARVVKGA